MQIVEQSAGTWGLCPHTYEEAMDWIAAAARTCYLSETVGPAEAFIAKLLKPDPPHSSVLEHSLLVARKPMRTDQAINFIASKGFNQSKWLWWSAPGDALTVGGNFRAWYETLDLDSVKDIYDWLDDEGFEIQPQDTLGRDDRRVTVKLITDRAILAEITRHRSDVGFSVESQRYVDYGGREVSYVKPSWYAKATPRQRERWIMSCRRNEAEYLDMRADGFAPQHARVVLSNQVKTTIVMTAYLSEWDWIFKLRRAPAAYPQMIALMDEVYAQFERLDFL